MPRLAVGLKFLDRDLVVGLYAPLAVRTVEVDGYHAASLAGQLAVAGEAPVMVLGPLHQAAVAFLVDVQPGEDAPFLAGDDLLGLDCRPCISIHQDERRTGIGGPEQFSLDRD